jgi:hypothetical protein
MSIAEKIFAGCLLLFSTTVLAQGRLSPHFMDKGLKFETGKTVLTISVKDSVAFQKKYEGKITIHHKQGSANCFVVSPLRDALEMLKNDPNILFIDRHRKAVAESILDYANPFFNRITKAHHFFPDLNGATQNISVKEQGFDPSNIDLIGRSFITSVTPSSTSQHATTMTVLIAGAGNSSYQTKGVAPQAHFTASDFNNLLPDAASIFNANNIHVQNHSYGVDIENYYGNEAYAYDLQVYQNPTLVHVFSAGNLGKSKPSSGAYQNMSFANLSGNFKQAKNVLVVNAVDTTLTINALNSRGPAFDGRLKPELTAYGQGGTSEAAALISGTTALIQEKHKIINGELPDASMVKAVLIASADDRGPQGIDYLYGYGSVNTYKAIRLVELNQVLTTSLASNTQVSLPINIPAFISEIKIAIAWTDPPAAPNANQVLVNDIDSWLDDGATKILPWVLSAHPHTDSLLAAPKRKADHLNNVEFITLNSPAPGLYQLILKSGNLTNAAQKVSVAYWLNESKTFGWDFPAATDIVESGKRNLLLWEALPNQTGDLYLQLNRGNYTLVKSGIDLNGFYYWNCPDTLATAKLKMKIGTDEFVSDEFLLSPLLKMKTAFLCADSIGLEWSAIKKATGYELYTLGTQYLKKISATTDTLVVLPKSSDTYFSVAPVMNGLSGLKSETINYAQQGSFCYLNLFAAERFDATQVRVQLAMSSWYQVDHTIIFKTANGVKTVFKNLLPGNVRSLDFFDTELVPGTVAYQAEITFKNGSKILSDVNELIIEGKGKAILYPNPVTSDSYLNIQSQGGKQKFRVLDLLGKIVFETELELIAEQIDTVNLPAGLYIYQLLTQEKVTDVGRFVKW